jgi:RNA polymerase sigma factor (sigma-70 family)
VDAALETTRLAVRPEPTSSSDDPETKALNQAHYEALWKCLRALEPRQFELVRLRYFTSSELTLQAIADSLGFSLATAHGRLQQAFTRLRRCLQAQGWDVQ